MTASQGVSAWLHLQISSVRLLVSDCRGGDEVEAAASVVVLCEAVVHFLFATAAGAVALATFGEPAGAVALATFGAPAGAVALATDHLLRLWGWFRWRILAFPADTARVPGVRGHGAGDP